MSPDEPRASRSPIVAAAVVHSLLTLSTPTIRGDYDAPGRPRKVNPKRAQQKAQREARKRSRKAKR